jgi:hypothetical protein
MRDDLPRLKKGRTRIRSSQPRDRLILPEQHRSDKEQHVDDDQIFDNRWGIL